MKRGPYLSKGGLKRGIAHFKYSEGRKLRSLEIPPTLTTDASCSSTVANHYEVFCIGFLNRNCDKAKSIKSDTLQ